MGQRAGSIGECEQDQPGMLCRQVPNGTIESSEVASVEYVCGSRTAHSTYIKTHIPY